MPAPPRPAAAPASTARPSSARGRLERLGRIAALGLQAGAFAARPSAALLKGLAPALWVVLRTGVLPAIVVVAACAAAITGVQLGGFLANNGQLDRLGGYLTTTSLRWLGPTVATVALAVAAGARVVVALASPQGDEGDVAGRRARTDTASVARLVATQVIAFATAAVILDLIVVPVGVGSGLLVAVGVLDAPPGAVLATLFANAAWVDLARSVACAGVAGLLIGLLSCYAGLEAAGHTPERRGEHVGRGDSVPRAGAGEGADPSRAVRDALIGSVIAVLFVNVVLGTYVLAVFSDIRFSR